MSNPIQRLAAALRPPPVEELAAALQACLNDAVERGAERVKKDLEPRLDRMDSRLDRQDDTLRMIWKQCGGNANQRLPIDEGTDR